MSADVEYDNGVGILKDVIAASRRAKKHAKFGFYIVAEELSQRPTTPVTFLSDDARRAYLRGKIPLYNVQLFAPARYKHDHAADEDALNYIVIQQYSRGGEPTASRPLSLQQATKSAASAKGVISTILKKVRVVDNRNA